MNMPPAMQALVIISQKNPPPGAQGVIECPRCGNDSFHWWKEKAIGKLSGGCGQCGLKLPRG